MKILTVKQLSVTAVVAAAAAHFNTFGRHTVFDLIVINRGTQAVSCQVGTMHLDRRQSVKCFSYRQISQFQRFLDRLAFSKLCCHTAGSDSRTAAKSLETDIGNDIVFDFNKNLHDIAAFGIAYSPTPSASGITPTLRGIHKMIHYFFHCMP